MLLVVAYLMLLVKYLASILDLFHLFLRSQHVAPMAKGWPQTSATAPKTPACHPLSLILTLLRVQPATPHRPRPSCRHPPVAGPGSGRPRHRECSDQCGHGTDHRLPPRHQRAVRPPRRQPARRQFLPALRPAPSTHRPKTPATEPAGAKFRLESKTAAAGGGPPRPTQRPAPGSPDCGPAGRRPARPPRPAAASPDQAKNPPPNPRPAPNGPPRTACLGPVRSHANFITISKLNRRATASNRTRIPLGIPARVAKLRGTG